MVLLFGAVKKNKIQKYQANLPIGFFELFFGQFLEMNSKSFFINRYGKCLTDKETVSFWYKNI